MKQLQRSRKHTTKGALNKPRMINYFLNNYYVPEADTEGFITRVSSIYSYCIENNVKNAYIYAVSKKMIQTIKEHFKINLAAFINELEALQESCVILDEFTTKHLSYEKKEGMQEIKVLDNTKMLTMYSYLEVKELNDLSNNNSSNQFMKMLINNENMQLTRGKV